MGHADYLEEVMKRKLISHESTCEALTAYLHSTDSEQLAFIYDVSGFKSDFF